MKRRFAKCLSLLLALALLTPAGGLIPAASAAGTTKTQYRYHRYITADGRVSLCPYFGESSYGGAKLTLQYTDWLDEPLPVNSPSSNHRHVNQGAACTSRGCIDPTCNTARYTYQGSNWYYEETRSVAATDSTSAPASTPAPTQDNSTAGVYAQKFVDEALKYVGYSETEFENAVAAAIGNGRTVGVTSGEWCAQFVSLCAEAAGMKSIIPYGSWAKLDGLSQDGLNTYSLPLKIINAGGQKIDFVKGQNSAQVGDIICFENSSGTGHIGIVCGVSGKMIYVVHGNFHNTEKDRTGKATSVVCAPAGYGAENCPAQWPNCGQWNVDTGYNQTEYIKYLIRPNWNALVAAAEPTAPDADWPTLPSGSVSSSTGVIGQILSNLANYTVKLAGVKLDDAATTRVLDLAGIAVPKTFTTISTIYSVFNASAQSLKDLRDAYESAGSAKRNLFSTYANRYTEILSRINTLLQQAYSWGERDRDTTKDFPADTFAEVNAGVQEIIRRLITDMRAATTDPIFLLDPASRAKLKQMADDLEPLATITFDEAYNLGRYGIRIDSTGVNPEPSGVSAAQTQKVLVDGRVVEFQMYSLSGPGGVTNYVKLRDLADALDGTAAQFNVTWSKAAGVGAETGKPYTSRNGTENVTNYSGSQSYQRGAPTTNVDGIDVALNSFTLKNGAYTYYKLRDLGQALGFNVGYDRIAKMAFIETDKPYDGKDR